MPALQPESGSGRWLKHMKKKINRRPGCLPETSADLCQKHGKRRVTTRYLSTWFLRVSSSLCVYVHMVFCIHPHGLLYTSLWFLAYVLKVSVYVLIIFCVCPHTFCMCPYAFCVLGKTKVGVWGHLELVDLCWRETLGTSYDVVSEGEHETYIPPLFKV